MASGKISIYISGAHGAGKTTLQRALQQDEEFFRYGFKSQEEIARIWIAHKGYIQEDLHQPHSFYQLQNELLEQQVLAETNEVAECGGCYSRFLWDRGVADAIAYVKAFFGREKMEECMNLPGIQEELKRWKRADDTLVVIPRPEKEFNVCDGTRRESDMEEIIKIHRAMLETLQELGIPHLVLNVYDIEKRVRLVIDEVKRKWPWITEQYIDDC